MNIITIADRINLENDAKLYKTNREKGNSLICIPNNYTIIDIETTGLDARYDQIIEIGALKVENGSIVDKFESFIKPNGFYYLDDNENKIFSYVDEFITNLTGITNVMLEKAPSAEVVLPNFIKFINNDILIGHNVNFDINFLYDITFEKLKIKLQNDYVDLMRLSRKIYPEFKNHKLNTIAKNLNITLDNNHRAFGDCNITHECLIKLADHITKNSINLEELFNKRSSALDLTKIKGNTISFNEEHPLYNKYCTFTGKLEKMERKEAAQFVVGIGGYCLNSVTTKTNFLVLGNFEYCSNIKGEKSSKLRKAEKLILEGQDSQIVSENVFYDLIL